MMKLIMILALGLSLQGCATLADSLAAMGNGLQQGTQSNINNRPVFCSTQNYGYGNSSTTCQ